ncbi:MAG: Ig-like domain-containing protein, partial [Actinobacteria bacterium]|nr:Ig-like domain-containing protein [Actinomycetota bacterium]
MSPSNNANPSWSFTVAADAVTTTCTLTRGGTVISAAAPCTSPVSYSLAGKPDGVYTLTVTTTDVAGNSSSSSSDYTYDTTAPVAPVITAPVSPSNNANPSWSFTVAADAVTTTCTLTRGATVISAAATCAGSATYDLTGLPDGVYTLTVTTTDAAGNASSSSADYTYDTTPPAAAVIIAPSSPSNGSMPTWTFTVDPTTASTTCSLTRGGIVVDPVSACSSPVAYNLTGNPDGIYTLTVTVTDVAGNSSSSSSTYTYDTTAPTPAVISAPPSPSSDPSPTWTFTVDPSTATSTCELARGATIISPATACSGTVTYNLSTQPDGDYTLTIVTTDSAGNASSAVSTYTFD